MLDTGNLIRVHGNVELSGLKPGVYRVSYVYDSVEGTVYSFAKPKGRRPICAHLAYKVDARVCDGTPSRNCIERLPR